MVPILLAPLPALLGIRPGSKVSVINPPAGFLARLNPLPDGVEFLEHARTGLDVILFFAQDKLDLVERLPKLVQGMAVTGGIWVFWSSAAPSAKGSLSEEFVRMAGFEMGLVDNKLIPVDEEWTGLRLVWKPRAPRPEPRRSSAQA